MRKVYDEPVLLFLLPALVEFPLLVGSTPLLLLFWQEYVPPNLHQLIVVFQNLQTAQVETRSLKIIELIAALLNG